MRMKIDQFQRLARHLVEVLEVCRNDESSTWELSNWSLENNNQTCPCLVHPAVYATYQEQNIESNNDMGDDGGGLFSLEDDEIIADEQVMIVQDSVSLEESRVEVKWHFSIVYSDTYGVPVLYFRVQTLDGSPCERFKILEWLPNQSIEDNWDFISQEEHPISGLPSYFLHPCQTSGRLAKLLQSSQADESILWAWMSMIFPAVSHPIPSSFFHKIQRHLSEGQG